MTRFSESDRRLLNQLIITCEINRLTEKESVTYIKRKCHKIISRRTFYYLKKKLYEEKILRKSNSFRFMGRKPLLPERRFLNENNEESEKYSNIDDLDFIPEHFYKLFSDTNSLTFRSRNRFSKINEFKEMSIDNYQSVPLNATLRKEYIKCGNCQCHRCNHGPYYYAYWRDVKGILRKKYIGKYDPRKDETFDLIDLTPLRSIAL